MSKPRKPSVRAAVDVDLVATGTATSVDVTAVPRFDAAPIPGARPAPAALTAPDLGPFVLDGAIDTAPIYAAAEASGLQVSALAAHAGLVVVTCARVPPFAGVTVAEVAAKIRAYNCKHCGTGGGHTPNCGR